MDKSNTVPNLNKAFNAEDFRTWGHQLIDLLASHLESVQHPPQKGVIPYREPALEHAFWKADFHQGPSDNPMNFFMDVLNHSISVHHPNYMGHQVSVPAPIAALSGLMTDVLSNGTGVYEMGMASNVLEKIITDWLALKIGYSADASGIITSGGSLANLTAMLAARKAKAPTEVWEHGHQEKLAVLVSEEAHYCIDRAARILGMGSEGIIKIPVDSRFKMKTELLEEYLQEAKDKGFSVISLVGCASSTATGSYDDLEAQADFCEKHNLWFHVDGAHGGGVVLSDTYRHLAKGIERADSITIDFHKMLLTPSLNTALMFKRGEDSYKTFQQKAQYLWSSQESPEWYHSGKRAFECTKLMLSTKVYAILKTYGEDIFGENIDRLFGLARSFAAIIHSHPDFELAVEPEANIVNFRYTNANQEDLNKVNESIREQLILEGNFYIVSTLIRGQRFLRTAIMNPLTQEENFHALLNKIQEVGRETRDQTINAEFKQKR